MSNHFMMASNETPKEILLISIQKNLSALGLKYVHYYLLDKGWHSHLLHLPYFDPNNLNLLENLQSFVSKTAPIFIGLSLMSSEYDCACDLSNYLKKHFLSIPIIWGGIHPTIDQESCFPFADYVCVGEGEKVAIDVANAIVSGQNVNKVLSLCYREDGQMVKNPLSPRFDNLDDIPFFDHVPKNSFLQKADGTISIIDKKLLRQEARYQGRMYELMTSRGCAFSCTYCCNNFLSQLYDSKKIRRRSIDNIMAELVNAIEHNPEISVVHFQDDSFLACSRKYLEDFCVAYRNRIRTPFIIHTMPIYVTRDKLRLLNECGVSWLNMGLQSGSDRVNKDIYNRGSTKDHFLRAAELVKEFKIAGKYDVILDNPFENECDRIETIETLIQIPKPYLLEFYSLAYYPGTELYKKAIQECPEEMESVYKKDYKRTMPNTLNELTALAIYLPGKFIKLLLFLYKGNTDRNYNFKIAFSICRIFLMPYYKFKTLFKVLKLANRGSYIKTIMSVPMYFTEMVFKKNI